MCCVQMKDYGDLSYLLDTEYERQLVALSQDAELRSLPIGTRGLTKGKVSLAAHVQTSVSLTATMGVLQCMQVSEVLHV